MELSKRQVQITEWVRKDGFLTVEALAEKYNVTTQTIRRDLTTLCDFGLARRRHGGIERPAEVSNLAYGSRQILARGAKQAIATLDAGPAVEGSRARHVVSRVECPRDKSRLITIVDRKQPHIQFEACTSCGGTFLDAGELKDLSERTLRERLATLLP